MTQTITNPTARLELNRARGFIAFALLGLRDGHRFGRISIPEGVIEGVGDESALGSQATAGRYLTKRLTSQIYTELRTVGYNFLAVGVLELKLDLDALLADPDAHTAEGRRMIRAYKQVAENIVSATAFLMSNTDLIDTLANKVISDRVWGYSQFAAALGGIQPTTIPHVEAEVAAAFAPHQETLREVIELAERG